MPICQLANGPMCAERVRGVWPLGVWEAENEAKEKNNNNNRESGSCDAPGNVVDACFQVEADP